MLNDPKVPFKFQPVEGGPTYFLKVPTVHDRVRYREELRADGAVRWSELQMLTALADGVRELLKADEDTAQRDDLLLEIDGYRERLSGFAIAVRDGEVDQSDPIAFLRRVAAETQAPQRLMSLREIVAEHIPAFKRMLGKNEAYSAHAGLVAARMFLLGWEDVVDYDGSPAPFRRTLAGVPDEILRPVTLETLSAIGAQIEQLIEPPQARLGNFLSGSGMRSDRTPSSGTRTRRQKTRSMTTAGPAPSSELMN